MVVDLFNMGNLLFVKLVWKTDDYIRPVLRVVGMESEKFAEMSLTLGEQFNIQIMTGKYCIGTELDRGRMISCSENQRLRAERNAKDGDGTTDKTFTHNKVKAGLQQCFMCGRDDFYMCRKICIGDACNPSSPRAKELCAPAKTSVYLTHVGGELKVGVSLSVMRRWLEQGSDYSTEIGKFPGLEARRLERATSQEFSVKTQVRGVAKVRNINPLSLDDASNEIISVAKDVFPLAKKITSNVEAHINEELEIIDLTEQYGQTKFERPIDMFDMKKQKEFGGKLVSIKGSLLIVSQQDMYYFALDTKQLVGRPFAFLDRKAKMSKQSSLSEFF